MLDIVLYKHLKLGGMSYDCLRVYHRASVPLLVRVRVSVRVSEREREDSTHYSCNFVDPLLNLANHIQRGIAMSSGIQFRSKI